MYIQKKKRFALAGWSLGAAALVLGSWVTLQPVMRSLQAALQQFMDVGPADPYQSAIEELAGRGIVNGYPDGTFRSSNTINRAEFVTIAMKAAAKNLGAPCTVLPFSDVPFDAWFAMNVCIAYQTQTATGYGDGTFRPQNEVTFVEAAAMITRAFEYQLAADPVWYKPAYDVLSRINGVPPSVRFYNQPITRGEMAYIVAAVLRDKEGAGTTPLVIQNPFGVPPASSAASNTVQQVQQQQFQNVQAGQQNLNQQQQATSARPQPQQGTNGFTMDWMNWFMPTSTSRSSVGTASGPTQTSSANAANPSLACGNGICDAGESFATCSIDCRASSSRSSQAQNPASSIGTSAPVSSTTGQNGSMPSGCIEFGGDPFTVDGHHLSVSDDGTIFAFNGPPLGTSANLIYTYNRSTRKVAYISGNGRSPTLSHNGKYLAFVGNIQQNETGTLYVYDLSTNELQQLPISRVVQLTLSISDDGNFIAFEQALDDGQYYLNWQYAILNRTTGQTRVIAGLGSGLVSHTNQEEFRGGGMSADGNQVGFSFDNVLQNTLQTYVYNRTTDSLSTIQTLQAGGGGNFLQLSADGRYIFGVDDVSLIHDRQTNTTSTLNLPKIPGRPNASELYPLRISNDGRYVLGQAGDLQYVYGALFDRQTNGVAEITPANITNGNIFTMSGKGRVAVYGIHAATNTVGGTPVMTTTVYAYDLGTKKATAIPTTYYCPAS